MDEIVAATGGPQYNLLRKLQARGWRLRRVKEGRATRYFADPPPTPAFKATLTSKGQVTLPKEVRDQLGMRAGQKVRFTLEDGRRVVLTPIGNRLSDLFGILPKPKRTLTLEEMDEGIARAVVERFRRAVGSDR